MGEMLDQQDQTKATKELLEEIELAIARQGLRKAVAEADQAETTAKNQNRLESAQIREVEERTEEAEARRRDVENKTRVRWFLAVAAVFLAVPFGRLATSAVVPPETTTTDRAAAPKGREGMERHGTRGRRRVTLPPTQSGRPGTDHPEAVARTREGGHWPPVVLTDP